MSTISNTMDKIEERAAELIPKEVKEYVAAARRKKELNRELRDVQAVIDMLEPKLEELFIQSGVSSLKVDGATVYLGTQVFVSPNRRDGEDPVAAKERACRALKAAGMGWAVAESFNVNTLRAALKERIDNGESIPEELQDALNITERQRVRVRGT